MNPHLARLCHLAQQPSRRVVGLMSGTSLDGLDVALCCFTGHGPATRLKLERFATVPYDDEVRRRVLQVFARPTGSIEYLTLLNAWLGRLHGQLVLDCLRQWGVAPAEVDLVASHGQTVYHAPGRLHQQPDFAGLSATLQLGDGDHVAATTGIITLSDFRQAHLAAGGEGAPLATYGDYLLLSSPHEPRLLLNLGGIANFTYLPPAGQAASAAFSTDTGPGNTLLDAVVQRLDPARRYDEGGRLALAGQPHAGLLAELLRQPFFEAELPKTTGPEQFNLHTLAATQAATGTDHLPAPDLLATLVELSAQGVRRAVAAAFGTGPVPPVYLSGGGAHNPALVAALARALPGTRLGSTDELGVPPDAKEAILFAVLANEAVAGQPVALGSGRQRVPAVRLGKVSWPG